MKTRDLIYAFAWGLLLILCGVGVTVNPIAFIILMLIAILSKDYDKFADWFTRVKKEMDKNAKL